MEGEKDKVTWISDLEKLAHDRLPQNTWNYISSGAQDEQTLSENNAAYDRLRIRPRMLRCIPAVDTSLQFLGQKLSCPIFVAPSALHKMIHPDGEVGTAKAAEHHDTCMALSTYSNYSMDEVANSAPNLLLLIQFYVFKNRDLTVALIRNAERAGFKALLLTIDQPVHGKRKRNFKLPEGIRLGNFMNLGELGDIFSDTSNIAEVVSKNQESELCGETIAWLKSQTKLLIFVKGILTSEDAKMVVEMGVDGIIVSNHGARQLDGVPSTIEALPEVVNAVNGAVDVLVDGGIRRGTDVFKAIALGAKAVFVGRPVLWGLAYNGMEGVKTTLDILRDEFERTMMLAGCADLAEITPSMVVHESYYWRTHSNCEQ